MDREWFERLRQNMTPQRAKALGIGAGVVVLLLLARSCGGQKQVMVVQAPAVEQKAQPEKTSPGMVDLKAEKPKGRNLDSFAGFRFGMSADQFKDVQPLVVSKWESYRTNCWEAVVPLGKPFRLFDQAVLRFTARGRRLYKVALWSKKERAEGVMPSSLLRESQYCAEIIERKYGRNFGIKRETSLYGGGAVVAAIVDSARYGSAEFFSHYDEHFTDQIAFNCKKPGSGDSEYAIAPSSFFHGFFNGNKIEVKCFLYHSAKENTLGVHCSAMDHGIIEQEFGRTKELPFDADDDADRF